MRRLHSRIVGWGSIVGTRPRRPSEVLLKGLPPPAEVDPARYRRFEREEAERRSLPHRQASDDDAFPRGAAASAKAVAAATSHSSDGDDDSDWAPPPPLEPFYDVVDVAAGSKHFAFVTRDGNVILVGCNRYGQIGQPTSSTVKDVNAEAVPYFYDFRSEALHRDGGDGVAATDGGSSAASHRQHLHRAATVNAVACGCNFSLFYRKGGCCAFAVGNNHHGQLGLGHKNVLDNSAGFAAWDPEAPWLQEERCWLRQCHPPPPLQQHDAQREPAVQHIVCGHTHTVIQMEHSGHIYTCGSNLWGELGLGNTTAPMSPTRMTFFEKQGLRVAQIAAGGGFTVYLTTCGRVFSCGASQFGQTPPNCFEPAAVPLVRVEAGKAYSSKLMRIKLIAATTDAVVYVTVRNEILLQGAFPELGVTVPFPRYQVIQGRRRLEADEFPCNGVTLPGAATADRREPSAERTAKVPHYQVVALHSGSNCVLVEYGDGALFGFGCNSDGQITLLPTAVAAATVPSTTTGRQPSHHQQVFNERLSPAHCIHQVVPIALLPSPHLRALSKGARIGHTVGDEASANDDNSPRPKPSAVLPPSPTLRDRGVRFAVSSSGVLVLDHAELLGDYDVLMAEDPIELPPGSAAQHVQHGQAARQVSSRGEGSRDGTMSSNLSPPPPSPQRFRRVKF